MQRNPHDRNSLLGLIMPANLQLQKIFDCAHLVLLLGLRKRISRPITTEQTITPLLSASEMLKGPGALRLTVQSWEGQKKHHFTYMLPTQASNHWILCCWLLLGCRVGRFVCLPPERRRHWWRCLQSSTLREWSPFLLLGCRRGVPSLWRGCVSSLLEGVNEFVWVAVGDHGSRAFFSY